MRSEFEQIKKIKNRLDKTIYFAAILAKELKDYGIKPVLVGGGALEFYTRGHYMTMDIDLVVQGRDQAKEALEKFGFERSIGEKSWYHDELELSVEIPDDVLAGSMNKIVEVEFDDGLIAYVIGVEDLIADRLNAYKWWQSLSDGQWATALLAIHYADIDFDYLQNVAGQNGIEDVLGEIMKEARRLRVIKDR